MKNKENKKRTVDGKIRSAFYESGDAIAKFKNTAEFSSDENLRAAVLALQKNHDEIRDYLNSTYLWD
jgi:hypothetical protein